MSLLANPESLTYLLDTTIASTGTIGYLALLGNALFQGTLSFDTTDSSFTSASAHRLQLGSRITLQISSGGTLPPPLATNVTYYAKPLSSIKFQVCATLAQAINNSPIQLNTAGTGTISATELKLNSTDSLEILLSKEITLASNYARPAIGSLGTSSYDVDRAKKPPKEIIIRNDLSTAIVYSHELVLFGGTSSVGDSTSITAHLLQSELVPVTMAAGEVKSFTLGFSLKVA